MTNENHPAMPETRRGLEITRVFDAPRSLVFRAWTQREHLLKWWGPKGFEVFSAEIDLRPGGAFLYGLRGPNDLEIWGKWVYREIVEPERLVFVASFSDVDGKITRNPFTPDWPLEVFSTLTFDDRDGKTVVTIKGTPISANEPERKTFEDGIESMHQGWGGTLDKLDDYLPNV